MTTSAEAFERDLPEADVLVVESGRLTWETHAAEIGAMSSVVASN